MSSLSAAWCAALYPATNAPALVQPLSYLQANQLSLALNRDAGSFAYSSAVSLVDAIQALERQFYSWATVKLYYSCYYSIKSILCTSQICIFYLSSKPYLLNAVPSALPAKVPASLARGGTHGSALSIFQHNLAAHKILSQPIDGEVSLEWLKHRREEVNYQIARFLEPSAPQWFQNVAQSGIRKTLNSYIKDMRDGTYLYSFDPDHSMLALPMLALKSAIYEIRNGGGNFAASDISFINGCVFDNAGPIKSIEEILS